MYALWYQVVLSIYKTHTNGWDANTSHIAVIGRSLHSSFQIFQDTLDQLWEMGQEVDFGKICGGWINLCTINSQVYSKQ